MFDNVESKLKTVAKVNFVAGIIMAAICLFAAITNELLRTAFVVLTAVMIVSGLVGSWLIYGFAEMIESSKEICKLACATDFGTVKESEKLKLKHEKEARQREREAQKRKEEMRQRELEVQWRMEQERAKKERINAYWSAHPDEKEKLLAKKAEAERVLNSAKNLDAKTRDKIKTLINSIDYELNKDR